VFWRINRSYPSNTLEIKSVALSNKQVKYLKSLAHKLQPVVNIGQNGVTEPVMKEVEQTLLAHELIKLKIRCDDQDEFKALTGEVLSRTNAELVQTIGHTIVLFRSSEEEKISLPN